VASSVSERSTTTVTILCAGATGGLTADHHRHLGDVVRRHGGRSIAAAGDTAVAAFDAASQAIAAAVAAEHLVAASADPGLGVGIAAGDVVWQDGDCAGLPVVTATRLQLEAGEGQILISHVVRLLAGDRVGEGCAPVGPLLLDGVPGPTDAFTVEWRRPTAAEGATIPAPPLPLAWRSAPAHALVGRSAAMAALEQAWALAVSGSGQIVLLSGEVGTGKTRLATEFGRAVHRAGGAVLLGTCDDDLALPYQPWVQAVDQLLATLDPATVDADLAGQLAPLSQLAVHLGRVVPSQPTTTMDPDAARYRLYEAFGVALGAAAARWPTLVVLDDLHWAGAQTLALLRHLARSGVPGRLLVIGTFRDTSDELTEPLATCLADLRRVAAVTRLRLDALDAPAVERYVADAVGHDLDAELTGLAAELGARSGGNAFFVGELWRHLVTTRAVAPTHGRWAVHDVAATSTIPDSVREVVASRLARLSPAARRMIEVAAVAGQRVDLDVLARALGVTADDLDATLGELVAAGLLTATDATSLVYRFEHSLVRETVEAAVAPGARRRAHLAIAEALEDVHAADRRPVLAELARHLAAAAPIAPVDTAVYYARRAAAQAARSAAYDEAASHLAAALALGPPPVERARLLVDLAMADLRMGQHPTSREHSREAFTLARDAGDADLTAEAALLFELATHFPGLPGGPAVELLRQAIGLTGDGTAPLQVRLQASLGRALAIEGRRDEAEGLIAVALARARDIDDGAALLVGLEAVATSSDDPTTVLDAARELEALATQREDPWSIAYGCVSECRAEIALGDLDAAARSVDRLRTANASGRFPMFELMGVHLRAILAMAGGDLATAEALAEQAFAHDAADESVFGAGVYGVQMFTLRRIQGRLAEVAPIVRLLAATADPPPVWRPGLAALYAELGMLDEAAALFADLAPASFATIPRDAMWPACLAFLAETCVALGDREQAPVLMAELSPMAGRNLTAAFTMSFGPADRLLADLAELAGEPDVAEQHFHAALALAGRSGSPLWTAEILLDWAAACAGRGEVERAAELGRRGATLAARIGMGRQWRSGAPRRARPPDPRPDGLSAREIEVLRCIADGLSNRDIGGRLFISQNTVANHVRAILRKTGCANRTEATSYAHRAGLVSSS
jgi:DNA-binding CsgD family transcriptional regulator/tetratricopeptide (TPR) repeat protein